MILKTTIWFIIIWSVWFFILYRIYSPESIPIYFSQTADNIQVKEEEFSRKLTESFAGKIGSELLKFKITVFNNYQLAFESEKADPKLAYSGSILSLDAKGNNYNIDYQHRKRLDGVFSKEEMLTQVKIMSMKTKSSPQQTYGPDAQINISAVGHVELIPQLSCFSKLNIGIFALLSLFALINWLKGFFFFIRNGPKKYFFQD